MLNLRPFEIALIGVFGAVAIGGLIFISVYQSKPAIEIKTFGDKVVIWGPFEEVAFKKAIDELIKYDMSASALEYSRVDIRYFHSELLNAIAEGRSPDLIILPHTMLLSLRSTLSPISYESYPSSTFKETYVDGAEIFMMQDGVYALPFAVDPLLLYWNRDIFASGGIALPPRTWESLVSETVPALVRQNQRLELTQSAVSLGEYVNVVHAKAILSTLFLQSGSNLVIERGGRYDVSLNNYAETGIPTGQASLAFYTQFASPQSGAYSWNRSLQSDRMKFLGGTLGMYFAPASEYASLLKGNPNLNFELAAVPQGSSATTYRNFGTFYAFAIPLRAENQAGAKLAARALAEPAVSERIITALDLGPVHRSLIARTQTDSFKKVLYQSSLIARGWLDPDPEMSDTVFKEMVESVTSGRQQTISAVSDATEKLRLLIK